jgi:probable F420-dependent oxidoreductase
MTAAETTTTLRLASHVFNNDFHNPVMLAAEAATLDLLSDGRLEFGLGAGWYHDDYAVAGRPFDRASVRIQRLAEAIQLIKGLWGDGPLTFRGTTYQVQDLDLHPKPMQRPHPPIFIGGGGKKMLTLAAQEANIVGLDVKGTAAGAKDMATTAGTMIEQQVGWIRDAAGSRLPELEIHILVWAIAITNDRRQGAEQIASMLASWPTTVTANAPSTDHILESPQFLIGTVEQIAADLQQRRERYGISYITVFGDYIDSFSPVVALLHGK